MDYKELQKRATELGYGNVVGASQEDLEKFVKEKEKGGDQAAGNENVDKEVEDTAGEEGKGVEGDDAAGGGGPASPQGASPATSPASTSKPGKDDNVAVVYKDKREVRRYDVETHGKGFAKLANQFAAKGDYRVEFKKVEPSIKCPACGHRFNPDNK